MGTTPQIAVVVEVPPEEKGRKEEEEGIFDRQQISPSAIAAEVKKN